MISVAALPNWWRRIASLLGGRRKIDTRVTVIRSPLHHLSTPEIQVSVIARASLALIVFLEVTEGDELSPPEYSFHRCRASQKEEGRGANLNTIGPEKDKGGERDYNPTVTTAPTTTLNRSNKKKN
jgi:hypothetical protein